MIEQRPAGSTAILTNRAMDIFVIVNSNIDYPMPAKEWYVNVSKTER